MNRLELVRRLSFESKVTMREVAEGLGVHSQSLYRSLRSGLSLDKFVDIAHVCGYRVLVVDDGGHVITEVDNE